MKAKQKHKSYLTYIDDTKGKGGSGKETAFQKPLPTAKSRKKLHVLTQKGQS